MSLYYFTTSVVQRLAWAFDKEVPGSITGRTKLGYKLFQITSSLDVLGGTGDNFIDLVLRVQKIP